MRRRRHSWVDVRVGAVWPAVWRGGLPLTAVMPTWCTLTGAYEVASLSWIKRNIAKALFGTPPTVRLVLPVADAVTPLPPRCSRCAHPVMCAQATYEEALEFMESAERTDPGFWMMNRVSRPPAVLFACTRGRLRSV